MSLALPVAGHQLVTPAVFAQLKYGPVASFMVTVNMQLDELPAVSDVLQVTVVTPLAKAEPDEGLQTTGRGPSQASIAVAE